MLESEHIEKSRIERFCVSALPETELLASAEHLAKCVSCHGAFIACLKRFRGSEQLSFTLAPEYWSQHDHLDYEQLSGLADKTLDAEDRQILDTHLRICTMCREAVSGFLALREEVDAELSVPPRSEVQQLAYIQTSTFSWRNLKWKPIYAAAVVIIGIALVIGITLLLRRRTGNLEAKQNQSPQRTISPATQTPPPENQAVNVRPTPAPAPSQQLPRPAPSPPLTAKSRQLLKPGENAGAVTVLNDELGTVTVSQAGDVSGLDEIPQNTRQEIGETLIAQNLKAPEIANELTGAPINLRGPSEGPTFRLLSPRQIVITSDRPTFEWETLNGATSYKVLVGDLKGHSVATSELLPFNQTKWTALTPLKRGEIYSWGVEATVDGKKIYAPGATGTEMKFKVLSESSVRELDQIKKARSHLALGIFYAYVGMLAEAEREFQVLVRDNPRVPVLKKLLKQIQSWRKR